MRSEQLIEEMAEPCLERIELGVTAIGTGSGQSSVTVHD